MNKKQPVVVTITSSQEAYDLFTQYLRDYGFPVGKSRARHGTIQEFQTWYEARNPGTILNTKWFGRALSGSQRIISYRLGESKYYRRA